MGSSKGTICLSKAIISFSMILNEQREGERDNYKDKSLR